MAVNTYKTDFGYFSMIVDDEIYDSINSNFPSVITTYLLMEKNTITSDGEKYLSFFPVNDFRVTVVVNNADIESKTQSATTIFLPLADIKQPSDISDEKLNRYFSLDENHSVFVNYYTYSDTNSKYIMVDGGYKIDDDVRSTGISMPYGRCFVSAETFSQQNAIWTYFLVANSDMSHILRCSLFIQNQSLIDMQVRLTRSSIDFDNGFYKKFFTGVETYDPDPYSKGGTSGDGGGTGDFDGTSDDIPIPDLPTLSATSTNFITLFNPSLGELQNLANYMWSDLFDLDTFKKIFADPMDCILGLSIVPVAVPSGGSKAVTVGNISTGVTMQVASAQYVSVDCGTLNVNEYWGAYLDYDPYTKAEIYLPYIGTHPIAVDDIMGKAVHVVYHVDILSGACTAYVQCGGSVLYSFIGQCSASIPITGNDWTNVINGVLSIAGSIGSMVATGGMSAPLTALQAPVTAAKVGGALATGSSLASTAVNSLKPSVEKSGSMSGVGGMLAVQTPYIILTRPRQARPKQQNTYTGYPSFITSKLSKLTGYTEIEVIHMDGLTCTDSEAVEIESLLKSGVIF